MKLLLLLALVTMRALAQTYVVPLEVTPGPLQSAGVSVNIKADDTVRSRAILPGALEATIDHPLLGEVILHIPGGEPPAVSLLQNENAVIRLKRAVGHQTSVPYDRI